MDAYECATCGFLYDPRRGAPESGIPAGTPFCELPADFVCPVCGAGKEHFFAVSAAGVATSDVETVIQQVIARTPTVKSFRLRVPNAAPFKAGQYLKITLENAAALTKCLSISSSPTETGYLEVTKRITGSRFSHILNQAEPGFPVKISYPLGACTFAGEHPRIALLAGGIGITPLRSICRFICDMRLPTDAVLVYSNRSREEIVFEPEFADLQKSNSRLRVVHTLSRADAAWSGRRGRIDAALLKETVPDYGDRHFYVCGPPQMVAAMTDLLYLELRIDRSRVSSERFEGY